MSQDGAARFYKLEEEDITCSICFEELHDAVSITCGHTFCRGCITKYWDTLELQDYCCPECRKICPKDQLIPNYRLKHVVTKFQLAIKEEERRKVPGSALQLVYTDSGGILQLDDLVLQRCFLDVEVVEFSLCLICGIGERRKGKSTLLNYILRALHCLERSQKVSLGQYDEPLKGFEWRSGVDSVTKGIWIWSKPFILERNGEKMAVFVLDTEGSLDIVGDQENCLKLSALSMLLSSYLIFNVSACLNTTELDYLERSPSDSWEMMTGISQEHDVRRLGEEEADYEGSPSNRPEDMYRHVSKLTGEPFSLRYLQHMDILVRDWYDPDCCGREAADAYLQHEREKLKLKDSEYRGVLDILEGSSVSGFLLPHPGKRFQRPRSQGRLADMDDDFREHLTTYISDLAAEIWSCQKTTFSGEKITCGDVGKELKEFVIRLQRKQHRFSTTLQVFFSNENSKNMKTIENEFEKFLKQQLTASPFSVWPSEMRTRVSQQFIALLNKYEKVLKVGNNEEKETFMNEMRSLLEEKQEHFCTEYSKLFNKYSVSFHCVLGGGVVGLAGAIAGPAGAGIGASVGVAIGAGIFYAREK